MLQEVLQHINNYYIDDYCDLVGIEEDGFVVSNSSKFIANQYVLVVGSKLNDAVYKITSIVGNKLMVSDLIEEVTDCYIYGLAVPKAVLNIVTEVEEYNTKANGVTQESLGDYSVSYTSENGDVSWLTVFRKRLAPFRKAYLNIPIKTDDRFNCQIL